jgi:23S rRNA (cytidine1920-2'-O)/16S rRNA (cytidine1409-2'-O)-methyltransferase
VGYGQLHWRLRQDSRVEVVERTNVRYLECDKLSEEPSLATLDLSFISLKKVLLFFLQLGFLLLLLLLVLLLEV